MKTTKKYEFMTINQLAHALVDAANDTEFDFTFDTKESLEQYGEPTGWYGVKMINLYDEVAGTLCFGYYGGGCTQRIDLSMISEDEYDANENVKAIEKQLKKWFEYAYDCYNGVDTVCVAVTDSNEYETRYWAN